MKALQFFLVILGRFALMAIFLPTNSAAEITSSVWSGIGEGAHGDNGALIIGINPQTKTLSGFYESSDITGNVTAECKFYFSGTFQSKNLANIHIAVAHPDFIRDEIKAIDGTIELKTKSGKPMMTIYPSQIPQSCDWLYYGLPSYVPPKSFKLANGLPYGFIRNGDWKSVNIIRSKRAYFHSKPNESDRSKAFLVTGDLMYIYTENSDWYYVKYQNEKKQTVGWIKKSDTVQLPEHP